MRYDGEDRPKPGRGNGYQRESDIADQSCYGVRRAGTWPGDTHERDSVIPTRPTSRLGFRATMDESRHADRDEPTSSTKSYSNRPTWAEPIPEEASERDITTLSDLSTDADIPSSSISSPIPLNPADEDAIISNIINGTFYEDDIPSDVDMDIDLSLSIPSRPLTKPPGAMKSSSHRRSEYTPSMLSPHYSSAIAATTLPARVFAQHGYSRQAFGHLKWFWSLREDDWDRQLFEKDDDLLTMSIFRDIVTAATPTPSSGLPAMTSYPRRGDLSALRNPMCVHSDRVYAAVPMWTIAKHLWMYDMLCHLQKGPIAPVTCKEKTRPQPIVIVAPGGDETDVEMRASPTSGSSDDSDATLVESDSDVDSLFSVGRGTPSPVYDESMVLDGIGSRSPSPANVSSEHTDLSLSPLTKRKTPAPSLAAPAIYKILSPSKKHFGLSYDTLPPNVRTGDKCAAFETVDWQSRWEILGSMLRSSSGQTATRRPFLRVSASAPFGARGKSPKFFIAEDDDDSWLGTGSEDEDEIAQNDGEFSMLKPNKYIIDIDDDDDDEMVDIQL